MTRAPLICAQPGCVEPAVHRGRCKAHRRATGGTWERLRTKVRRRAAGRCERCGRGTDTLVVHHIYDVTLGNPEHARLDELEALCGECHVDEHRSRPPG